MPPTVLIVDDSSTMRSALKAYLREENLVFAEAESAERALALARLLRPSLALVDLNLPGMNGLELVRLLRAEPSLAHVPVLLVTGEDGDDWRAKSEAAGADGLVKKPVNAAALRERVRALLAGRTP